MHTALMEKIADCLTSISSFVVKRFLEKRLSNEEIVLLKSETTVLF